MPEAVPRFEFRQPDIEVTADFDKLLRLPELIPGLLRFPTFPAATDRRA